MKTKEECKLIVRDRISNSNVYSTILESTKRLFFRLKLEDLLVNIMMFLETTNIEYDFGVSGFIMRDVYGNTYEDVVINVGILEELNIVSKINLDVDLRHVMLEYFTDAKKEKSNHSTWMEELQNSLGLEVEAGAIIYSPEATDEDIAVLEQLW